MPSRRLRLNRRHAGRRPERAQRACIASADAPARAEARERRIALLREAVERGHYRADARAVAQAMLRAAAADLLQ